MFSFTRPNPSGVMLPGEPEIKAKDSLLQFSECATTLDGTQCLHVAVINQTNFLHQHVILFIFIRCFKTSSGIRLQILYVVSTISIDTKGRNANK